MIRFAIYIKFMSKAGLKLLICYTMLAWLAHPLTQNSYPVRLAIVENIEDGDILKQMVIPNISPNIYNYVVYRQWSMLQTGSSAYFWETISKKSVPADYG